jgi:hypothetical protein
MENLIIPSAIQSIRSFLIEMCGMKVKPWATTEETLAALHTTLVARHGCDIFWTSLRGLLETLARDLKLRQAATPGTLVDNELLDSERYATLLDEIRAALARQTTGPASFRRLASGLSVPALGLLLFLGGVASVGCSGSGLHVQARDAGPPDVVDTNTVPPTPDASSPITSPDAPPAGGVDAAKPEASPDLPRIIVTIPDAPPARDTVAAPDALAASQSDGGATVTIQDIMNSCNISAQEQQAILTCLAQLGDSWAGFAEEFAGLNCGVVGSDLTCFLRSRVCGGGYEITYPSDPNAPWICQPVLVYIGVRFV